MRKTMTALTQPQLPFPPVHDLVTSTRQLSKSSVGEEKKRMLFLWCLLLTKTNTGKQTAIIVCSMFSIRTTK